MLGAADGPRILWAAVDVCRLDARWQVLCGWRVRRVCSPLGRGGGGGDAPGGRVYDCELVRRLSYRCGRAASAAAGVWLPPGGGTPRIRMCLPTSACRGDGVGVARKVMHPGCCWEGGESGAGEAAVLFAFCGLMLTSLRARLYCG